MTVVKNMTVDVLWTYIKRNESLLTGMGIGVEFEDFQYGSIHENYSEIGEECTLTIHSRKYHVGTCTITEDGEDWAQAEAYQNAWCKDTHGKNIDPKMVFDLIQNFKVDKRDISIDSIISP